MPKQVPSLPTPRTAACRDGVQDVGLLLQEDLSGYRRVLTKLCDERGRIGCAKIEGAESELGAGACKTSAFCQAGNRSGN